MLQDSLALAARRIIHQAIEDEDELADIAPKQPAAEYTAESGVIVLQSDAAALAVALERALKSAELGAVSSAIDVNDRDRDETILRYVLSMEPLTYEEGYLRKPSPFVHHNIPRWLLEEFIEFCGEGSFHVMKTQRCTYADYMHNLVGRA